MQEIKYCQWINAWQQVWYEYAYLEYAFERVKIADLTLHNGTKDETSDNLK